MAGLAGAETAGAVNDFVRETVKFYPRLHEEEGSRCGDSSGRLSAARVRRRARSLCRTQIARAQSGSDQRRTRRDLRWIDRCPKQRHIDSCQNAHLDGRRETESGRRGFAVSERERTNFSVDEYLQVPGFAGLRAAGDCAAVPDGYETGVFYPPTAQHGLREAVVAAKNIERTILDQPLKPFRYRTARHAREHRTSHRRGKRVRIQILSFHRLVDVADYLSRQASAIGEEASCRHDLDTRSCIRPRHRTDDHVAQHRQLTERWARIRTTRGRCVTTSRSVALRRFAIPCYVRNEVITLLSRRSFEQFFSALSVLGSSSYFYPASCRVIASASGLGIRTAGGFMKTASAFSEEMNF